MYASFKYDDSLQVLGEVNLDDFNEVKLNGAKTEFIISSQYQ